MSLTDTAIRNAKPREKQYKLSDGKGMYVLVKKVGKYFRLDYRFGGKRKTLALGVYPNVKLQQAREERDQARKLIANGVDPAQMRKATKATGNTKSCTVANARRLTFFSALQNRCLICLCTGDLWDSWPVDRSRMNREIHVRICEGLRGKFPWSTRLPTF